MISDVRKLLPIGSVVVLDGGVKSLMITGVMQTDMQDSLHPVDFDYIGVYYPEGFVGNDVQFLFNHEDIRMLVFRGYDGRERKSFIEKLVKFYEEQERKGR